MELKQEAATTHKNETATEDERKLAELGYKQELKRTWSGFSNFAISFSAISILSGCFTTFSQAWNNGGPDCHFYRMAFDFRTYFDYWFLHG